MRKSKPDVCGKCSGLNLKKRVTTYPVKITDPKILVGKEVHVHRVELFECKDCGHLIPTALGQAKVQRLVNDLPHQFRTVS